MFGTLLDRKPLMVAAVVLSAALAACSQPTGSSPVVGTWVGKYDTTLDYSMIIKADGTLNVYDGLIGTGAPATGSWTYSGGTFKATYTYSGGGGTFSVAATMPNTNRLEGTWGNGTGTTDGGPFYLNRQ